MAFRRPNSVLMRARDPPNTALELMDQLREDDFADGVLCVQRGRRNEWCLSFRTEKQVEEVEEAFTEGRLRDFIAVKLRANEKTRCTLEGCPFEYSNENVKAQLEQYFKDLEIELETYTTEGMEGIFTGNRILKYKYMKKPPPDKVNLGRGVFGWLNNVSKEKMQDYKVKCNRCGNEGHLAVDCTEIPKCTKCREYGHETRECPEQNCDTCYSRYHIGLFCPKGNSARGRPWSEIARGDMAQGNIASLGIGGMIVRGKKNGDETDEEINVMDGSREIEDQRSNRGESEEETDEDREGGLNGKEEVGERKAETENEQQVEPETDEAIEIVREERPMEERGDVREEVETKENRQRSVEHRKDEETLERGRGDKKEEANKSAENEQKQSAANEEEKEKEDGEEEKGEQPQKNVGEKKNEETPGSARRVSTEKEHKQETAKEVKVKEKKEVGAKEKREVSNRPPGKKLEETSTEIKRALEGVEKAQTERLKEDLRRQMEQSPDLKLRIARKSGDGDRWSIGSGASTRSQRKSMGEKDKKKSPIQILGDKIKKMGAKKTVSEGKNRIETPPPMRRKNRSGNGDEQMEEKRKK